jgi:OOP family OmpA-OmpF porin
MKKYTILILLFTLFSFSGMSQHIQWGFKILERSSQRGSKEYAAVQALGMPNALPRLGENTKSWESNSNERESYIKIGYLTPIIPKQLIIGETLNPGHITSAYVYDASGKEYKLMYTLEGKSSDGLYQINTEDVKFYVIAVKIVWVHDNGPIGIDAVGLTTYNKPFKIAVNPNDVIKSNLVAKKMSGAVNSNYMEIGPLISPDGKTLYFSRRGDPTDVGGKRDEEDIWYSNWNGNSKQWDTAVNMGPPLNNKYPNFINSISPDGNTILLGNIYLADGTMDQGVSLSSKTDKGWGRPVALNIEDEGRNKSTMVSYYMSNSEKILMISNNRKGDSKGNNDIYVSFLKEDNSWTKPLNLGSTINTGEVEDAPFLASDDKTLYFTSTGFDGYGGSDIYMSRRLDDTWQKWSKPENLGPVVNSSHDESFFSLSASGKDIYFTSQTSDDENDVDMYVIELPKILSPSPVMLVYGRVFNSKTKEPIVGVSITFENLNTHKQMGMARSNYNSAAYTIVLPSGERYGYLAQKDGFISINENIDLTAMKDYKEYQKDLYLTPIEVGAVAVINNIFFDFDKSILKKESYSELDRLINLFKTNATMKIELSGYTDSIGTKAYNDKLSYKRAQAVYNYLTSKDGISKDRIVLKYYGESKPIASNMTAKGREMNRRVEFKILSK